MGYVLLGPALKTLAPTRSINSSLSNGARMERDIDPLSDTS
jgi:hypothetical protein